MAHKLEIEQGDEASGDYGLVAVVGSESMVPYTIYGNIRMKQFRALLVQRVSSCAWMGGGRASDAWAGRVGQAAQGGDEEKSILGERVGHHRPLQGSEAMSRSRVGVAWRHDLSL